jgi:hypothetical protein
MRPLCVALSLLVVGGCASTSDGGSSHASRAVPTAILSALVVGSAALAVGAALKSKDVGRKLDDDLQRGALDGRAFIDRDAEGKRWNRIARASAFFGGLAVIGLGIVWEIHQSDRLEQTEPSGAQTPVSLSMPSGARLSPRMNVPPPRRSVLFLAPADQRSATAR